MAGTDAIRKDVETLRDAYMKLDITQDHATILAEIAVEILGNRTAEIAQIVAKATRAYIHQYIVNQIDNFTTQAEKETMQLAAYYVKTCGIHKEEE